MENLTIETPSGTFAIPLHSGSLTHVKTMQVVVGGETKTLEVYDVNPEFAKKVPEKP